MNPGFLISFKTRMYKFTIYTMSLKKCGQLLGPISCLAKNDAAFGVVITIFDDFQNTLESFLLLLVGKFDLIVEVWPVHFRHENFGLNLIFVEHC